MRKIVVTYPPQPDLDAFEKRFLDVHLPLLRLLPGLARLECSRIKTAPETPNPAVYMVESYFPDKDTLRAALKSAEMGACVEDVKANIPGGNTVYLSEDIQE